MFPELLAAAIAVQNLNWFKVSREYICGPFAEIVESLTSQEYQEAPVWLGQQNSVSTVLMVNPKTSSWTIVSYQRETGCVIAAGGSSQTLADKLSSKTK